MKVVYKYPLKDTGFQSIELPEGYKILDVRMQNGTPCIWALVDTENKPVKINVYMYATGDMIDRPDLSYIGTIYLLDGMVVFHLFYKNV